MAVDLPHLYENDDDGYVMVLQAVVDLVVETKEEAAEQAAAGR